MAVHKINQIHQTFICSYSQTTELNNPSWSVKSLLLLMWRCSWDTAIGLLTGPYLSEQQIGRLQSSSVPCLQKYRPCRMIHLIILKIAIIDFIDYKLVNNIAFCSNLLVAYSVIKGLLQKLLICTFDKKRSLVWINLWGYRDLSRDIIVFTSS